MAVRVVAPAVQVAVGARVYQVDMGGLLPEGVERADLDRLVAKGMVVIEVPTIKDGAEHIEGALVVDESLPGAEHIEGVLVVDESLPNVTGEPVVPDKPQARKPAAK